MFCISTDRFLGPIAFKLLHRPHHGAHGAGEGEHSANAPRVEVGRVLLRGSGACLRGRMADVVTELASWVERNELICKQVCVLLWDTHAHTEREMLASCLSRCFSV